MQNSMKFSEEHLTQEDLANQKIDKYDFKYVKGMLLHGPPGIGKTLIARKIANALIFSEP